MNGSEAVRAFEDLIRLRRQDASEKLIPTDHQVDWADAPSKFSVYLDTVRVPLAVGLCRKSLPLAGAGDPARSECHPPFLDDLSDLLLLSIGLLRRTLAVNWTWLGSRSAIHRNASYARGAASGGGLYPVGMYLVFPDRFEAPGVYHYDAAHQALTRLRRGNFESSVREAVNLQNPVADFWLILTVRFWKSSFKYHNFGYQVASQDVGATVGSIEQVAHSMGWRTTAIYWFQDALVGSLLGLNITTDAPFVMLGVQRKVALESPGSGSSEDYAPPSQRELSATRARIYERSRKTFLPDTLMAVHRETLLHDVKRPTFLSPPWHLGIGPFPQQLPDSDLCSILKRRETCWGQFRRDPPLKLEHLMQVLGFVSHGAHYSSDLYGCRVALPTLRISVIAQSVSGLSSGVYDYILPGCSLVPRTRLQIERSLQQVYFLQNHNLDQVSAILVLTGRLDLVLKTMGGRGIRVMNAEIGIAAQRSYIAATALSLGCAAVLGFDVQRISALVDVDVKLENPMLLILVGHRSPLANGYEFDLI